jgi:hypothetical protein
MRTWPQWQTLIERTQRTGRAFALLWREWQRPGAQKALTEAEIQHLTAVLLALQAEIAQAEAAHATAASDHPQVNVDYRAEGLNGRGRLYLEVLGRQQRYPDEPFALPFEGMYLFSDDIGFAGLQVDDVNTMIERLEPVLLALAALDLPPLDCPEAQLTAVHIATVLEWAVKTRILS